MVAHRQQLGGISVVETMTGYERSTIRRKYRANQFPKPRYIGTRRMWLLSEVEEWIATAGEVRS
jgi:predicted DNA-binding transcriptional regulator AlpA